MIDPLADKECITCFRVSPYLVCSPPCAAAAIYWGRQVKSQAEMDQFRMALDAMGEDYQRYWAKFNQRRGREKVYNPCPPAV